MATPTAGTTVPGAAPEAAFPPFDSTHFSSQLVWLTLTFGVLYLLMSRIALPRVEGILSARRGKIDGDIQSAQAMQRQATEAGVTYEKTLTEAKAKAQALGQEQHAKLAAEADAKRKTVEAELNAKLAAAETQILATKASAMANVEGIAKDAAAAIVQQITGKPADADQIAKAVAAIKTA